MQRVTKYPLLLSRLYKVTPGHHADKNNIKLAQDKIEAALEQMNKVSIFKRSDIGLGFLTGNSILFTIVGAVLSLFFKFLRIS